MDFNSALFLLFLTVVVVLHYLSPARYRTSLLLFSSFIFIGYFNVESVFALLLFSLFNFYLAQRVLNNKFLYCLGLLVNVAAIVLFNYFNLVQSSILFNVSSISFSPFGFIMALGLSYYSLQNISYLNDVYFNRILPEISASKFFLHTAFFPKIISGPVMTVQEFIPQIANQRPSGSMIISGAQLFLFGLFKKMVLADRLSPSVHAVFDGGESYFGLTTLIAAYLFTIQLYFDFSGYTDMALGAGRMLGFRLKENFNLPFRSTSISDFWRRWHISLITWFTNYIYYPVVFKLRKHMLLAVFAGVFITFIVSAIWHGIGFTFLLWASCHVLYIWLERLTTTFRAGLKKQVPSLFYKLISVVIVFSAVSFSNIFFRSHSVSHAFQLIKRMYSNFTPTNWLADVVAPLAHGGDPMQQFNIIVTLLLCGFFLLFERGLMRQANQVKMNIPYIIIVVLIIMVFGIFNSGERFIYMQF